MSKKIGFVVAFVGVCVLSSFLASCGSSSSRPTGILYVITEAVNTNGNILGDNVSSYGIDLNTGGIALINSNASTCPTAATSASSPCGIPLGILLDTKGTTAFVLDQGDTSASVAPMIYGFPVNSDGSLGNPAAAISSSAAPLPGVPIAMTRDSAGQFLFVINEGFNPTSTNCANPPTIDCASISVFTMQSGSTSLTEVAGSPFPVNRLPTALSAIPYTAPAGNTLPCASTTDLLYVTYNTDPVYQNDNTLSAYCVDSSGETIDLTPNTPYVIASSNPISVLAVNTTPGETTGGIFVYVGSYPSGASALSIFQVCTVAGVGPGQGCSNTQVDNATLLPVNATPPPATGEKPVAMVVDPTFNFLYVVCQLANQVWGYRITTTTGALTALAPPNQPTGQQPVSLVMQPSVQAGGEYLFVSNLTSSNITGFTVNTSTGAMGSAITVLSNPEPSGMATQYP